MAVGAVRRRDTHDRKSFSRGQRWLIALNVLVMVAVAAAILGGIWYLASLPQFRFRVDLTREQAYTLSPRTQAILAALDKEVEAILITDLPGRDLTGAGHVNRKVMAYTLDLLREYEIRSGGTVRIEELHRVHDNLRVGEVLGEIGFGQADPFRAGQLNLVIVRSGGSRTVLHPDELARIDRGTVNPQTGVIRPAEVIDYRAEAGLTAAIIEVSEGKKPLACVLAGRGEAQITSEGSPDGISHAAAGLSNANFEVRELRLAAGGMIPEECRALIVAGPRDAYSQEEMLEIDRYLRNGGSIFLALDPFSAASFDTTILPAYGISLDRTITCRDLPAGMGAGDAESKLRIVAEALSRDSEITRSLEENRFAVLFYRTGALQPMPRNTNVTLTWLVRSPSDVWGDAHAPGAMGDFAYDSSTETRDQRILGMSCEGQGDYAGSRLVVFADSFFFSNAGIGLGTRGNLLLFTNAINWLAERETQLDIGPKLPYESRVELFEEEAARVSFYVLIIIPGAAAVLGLVVWWFRRR